MKVHNALEAKDPVGKVLDAAQREPMTRKGRPGVVIAPAAFLSGR